VRNGTKAFVGIVSLGVIASGYQAGLAAEVQSGFSAASPVIDQNPVVAPDAQTPASTPTDAASPVATPVASSEAAPTSSAAPASTPKPKASTAPAPAPVVASPAPVTNASGTTKNGSAVQYRFGTVQVSVTKAAGKITAVNLLQEGATGGRQAAFTYLADLAVQSNGSSFGNLSGATYTTDAFKQSLESALAKF
jgi:uncharacterized protein with FMN-binding domain